MSRQEPDRLKTKPVFRFVFKKLPVLPLSARFKSAHRWLMESPRSSGSRTAIRSSKHGSLQPDLSTSANSATEVVTAAAASAFDQHLFDSILSAIYVPEHHSTWFVEAAALLQHIRISVCSLIALHLI
jgi:hypothetical protein